MTAVPAKKPVKKKAPDPWIAWNEEHPELVCSESACPHNRQTIERRRTRPWQFMHALAHGHTNFSAAALAEMAGCPEAEAERTIQLGVEWKLILRTGQSKDGPTYSRFVKPKGPSKAPAKARRNRAFGQAAAAMRAQSTPALFGGGQ